MKHPLILLAIGAALIWDYGKNCSTCRANATGGTNNVNVSPLSVSSSVSLDPGRATLTRIAGGGGTPQPKFTAQAGNSVLSNSQPVSYSPGLHGGLPVPGHPILTRSTQSSSQQIRHSTAGSVATFPSFGGLKPLSGL